MNRPLKNDDDEGKHPDWNQSPNDLHGDGTTRQDLNGIANLRRSRDHLPRHHTELLESEIQAVNEISNPAAAFKHSTTQQKESSHRSPQTWVQRQCNSSSWQAACSTTWRRLREFASFLGPGFMVAVAYIDPGNYATDVAAGAATQYKLLFVVLMSNIFAVVLQSLAIRLGSVTGKDLAQHCREHLPFWLNIVIYILAEAAIIATDLAEVIGSAIALNLLFGLNLVAGCAITLVDVLLILLFYNPVGSLTRLRLFEFFVGFLVLAVVICFCIQLSLIHDSTAGEVLFGYIPSNKVVDGQGIYLSCGILGATVMPHSIYLGSGLCQPRLRYYDQLNTTAPVPLESSEQDTDSADPKPYIPSLSAIRHCLNYSIAELIFSLTGFALFVNSAILITAGASLYSPDDSADVADLFSIFGLLSTNISRAAAIIFAVALFFSGTAAGIVCTIAGQLVSEGHLKWTIAPWLRRLLTRSISITPSIIIAATIGKDGLSTALNASQVALSVILPFVTAPLVYFTARAKFMTVGGGENVNSVASQNSQGDTTTVTGEGKSMRNHRLVSLLAFAIWLVITVMNVALLVLLGLGAT